MAAYLGRRNLAPAMKRICPGPASKEAPLSGSSLATADMNALTAPTGDCAKTLTD
jgi:hypothetical protein